MEHGSSKAVRSTNARHRMIEVQPPIRVAIVEDSHCIRESLSVLINSARGFECTQRFPSIEKALVDLQGNLPDVALVGLKFPGMSGTDVIRMLKQIHPPLHIIVHTSFDDEQRVLASFRAGASGYFMKKTPPQRLLDGIRDVMSGGAAMSPSVARRVIEISLRLRPRRPTESSMTQQELRILGLLVEGYRNKAVAQALGIRVSTVSTHIKHIYEKLRVHSKSQAVSKAIRKGLIDWETL